MTMSGSMTMYAVTSATVVLFASNKSSDQ